MNFVILVGFAIMTLRFVKGDGAGDWGYGIGNYLNPSQWQDIYKSCAGYRQTPIDINSDKLEYWEHLKPVTFTSQITKSSVYFKRSDLTVYLNFGSSTTFNFGNSECYMPSHIHWHWGSINIRGSEHTLNKVAYPMEGHLVTYNCKLYTSIDEAINSPSGLHVFGMLYEIGEKNVAIEKLSTYLQTLRTNATIMIPEIPPRMFLPMNVDQYYRYEGSLTTPPCTENVIWTVFQEIQTIDENQLNLFRSFMYGKPETGRMVDNFRPVVPIKVAHDFIRRTVYVSFNRGSSITYKLLLMTLTVSHIF